MRLLDQRLYSDLIKFGLTVKTGRTFTGKDISYHLSGEQFRDTVTTCTRVFRHQNDANLVKLSRQIGTRPVAEAIVVANPNATVSLKFGNRKFVDQCLEYLYVHLNYPELEPMLRLDNPDFETQLNERIKGFKRSQISMRRNEFLVKVLVVLATVGPRSLGGRKDKHFQTLGLKFRTPNKPKRVQRRRGYNDKGSLAPQVTRDARQSHQDYRRFVDQILLAVQDLRPFVEELQILWEGGNYKLQIVPPAGCSAADLRPFFLKRIKPKLDNIFNTIQQQNFPILEVVKDVNHDLRRG